MTGLENYAPDRPLILLTDYPPGFAGGGAINLKSVLDPETRRKVIWATLSPGPGPEGEGGPDAPTLHLRGGPGRTAPRASRSIWRDSTVLAGPLADELLEAARAANAAGLWVVLHGAAVPVAARLVGRGGPPMMVSVHDDPPYGVALRSRRYLAMVPWVERCLARALRGASGVEVVSRGMQERYRRRYGVESELGNRGVAPAEYPPAPYDKASGVLRVGVLGNTYAYPPLTILARAVAGAARARGLRGELVFVGRGYGARLRSEMAGAVDVVEAGQLEESAGAEVLRTCFIQYLNYPFGWRDRVLRRTSFPIKQGTYIAAGRPLLVHAPADSSTAELAEIPGLARHWASNDVDEGAAILAAAWDDPATSGDARAGLEELRRRYFDLETIRATVFGMLDRMAAPVPVDAAR